MSKVSEQLSQDHANLVKVLNCLDYTARRYFSADRGEQDLEIIQDAIEYMKSYADSYHHPLEESALERMMPLVDDAALLEVYGEISQQHNEIIALTSKLGEEFEAISNDQVIPFDEVNGLLDKYIQLQFAHLKTENEHFLPKIDDLLNDNALQELVAESEQLDDPLFGVSRRKDFDDLCNYILACERERE